MGGRLQWFGGALVCAILTIAAGFALLGLSLDSAATAAGVDSATHLGVATCAGSTCHGRSEPTGRVVRQDEILHWQDASSQAGAHSRAWTVLGNARGQDIARRLGIGDPQSAPMCLGCHADPGPRGGRFQLSDGVGCEACHGGSQPWLASHYSVSGTHANNVANGLVPLDRPAVRAAVCLDCHFGSDRPSQFVDHRIMAAGHPRVSFELDLFSTLQQHWNEDSDYIDRKGRSNDVRIWAVGQAMALERQLSLYAQPRLGQEGSFPEFYFFDCHTCHRRISDQPDFRASATANPSRPIPSGMPAFNDENMIMLSAAAQVVAPGLATKFDGDSRAFHAGIATDRSAAIAAAGRLRGDAAALKDAFARNEFSRAQTFAIIDAVTGSALARYTDYEGGVQAVMATDTLLSAMVNAGYVPKGSADGIRGQVNLAYAAVKDPYSFRPLEFRAALGRAANSIKALR